MILTETRLDGAFTIDLQPIEDERGFFARTWCRQEFSDHGLNAEVAQVNIGYSRRSGTLRGMHFQDQPHAEVKVVRCTRGLVYDVIIDLRPTSPTFKRWLAIELSAENHRVLYVPEGVAHGYQTLVDDTEICYQTSRPYTAAAARGVRYDDPAFGVEWALPVSVISKADETWPDFRS